MTSVSNDFTEVSNSATSVDFVSLEVYAGALATDCKNALDESKSYSVSPELQPAKDKYESALYEYNQAGYYGKTGANEFSNGNSEQGTKDIQTSTNYLKAGNTAIKEAKRLIDIYNANK